MVMPEPESDDRPSGPRSRKGEHTRVRLLTAAKAVFERSGFLDARVSDIAEEAGLSHGSFYHYFDSKEEVFREVAEAVENRLSAPLGTIILDPDSHASPRERISEAIRRHMEAYREEARMMGVIEMVTRYDEQMKAARAQRAEHYRVQVVGSIRRLQAHGLADTELDPDVAAGVLGSMTSRFPELWFVEGRVDPDFDAGVDQLVRMFSNALGLKDPDRRSARRADRIGPA